MGRRQRGEGGVSQRASDGLWVGSFDLGVIDGKRRRKAMYGRTQRDAVRKLAAARREFDSTGHLGSGLTVEAWMTHWITEIAPRRVRPSTLNGYRGKLPGTSSPSSARAGSTS